MERFGPFLAGCVTLVRRPCARPKRSRCPACQSGAKHPTMFFSMQIGGRTKNVYLPASMVPAIERGVANWRRLQEEVAKRSVATVERLKAEGWGR